jgi:hypothetical protein
MNPRFEVFTAVKVQVEVSWVATSYTRVYPKVSGLAAWSEN